MGISRIVALLGALLASSPVAARDTMIENIPVECRDYAWIPQDAKDDILGWNQLLSLATCLQDTTMAPISEADELAPMVELYLRGLLLPTIIYQAALENGPGTVQLRAAYQLGLAHVALIVRARASTPPGLQADLDPLLARSYRLAWITFATIDRAVQEEPELAPDAVTRNMVSSARGLLALLPEPPEAAPATLARVPPPGL